jgi:hypothetical protein
MEPTIHEFLFLKTKTLTLPSPQRERGKKNSLAPLAGRGLG